MQKIKWEIEAVTLPKAIRYCKRCHKKTDYESSGLFRINAQQKCLDIWLIYKCQQCDSTWKLTVFSRTNPNAIDAMLLERFHNNDSELAAHYASDMALLRKNGTEIELPQYKIVGDDIDLNTHTKLHIINKYPSNLKVIKILREKLNISNTAIERLITGGFIKSTPECDLKKCKLHKEMELEIGYE